MSVALTNTAYVILGLLAKAPMSGYDIKALADRSVRFFWNVGYGQIYPELKRLSEMGLAEPQAAARGERQRTVYRITPAGQASLHEWLVQGGTATCEMRDEMLLKLFFADAMSPSERLAHVRALRRREEDVVRTLGQIEPQARAAADPNSYRVLQVGIAIHRQYEESLAQIEAELIKEIERNVEATG
jgi:DNA-binding PadR family transcriptional regulator